MLTATVIADGRKSLEGASLSSPTGADCIKVCMEEGFQFNKIYAKERIKIKYVAMRPRKLSCLPKFFK